MDAGLIAVLDVGKTHAKLLIVDAVRGETVHEQSRISGGVTGPLVRELDVGALERWLFEALAGYPERARIGHIVPIAHGAAAVLLDAAGQALVAPDYEDPAFESVADAYRPQRDAFSATCSPFLPLGLNLGRQWYFLQQHDPALFDRVRHALLYPQYWAWRFCAVAASEITSLGCHSDLWRARDARFSDLAIRQQWPARLPTLHRAADVLGTVTGPVARATGLRPDCQVHCGLHDSNASYLCHLGARGNDRPFCVVSSGTWTVILAHGSPLDALDERLDMLANIDARGQAVATARFMGGREYARIAGPEGLQATATEAALRTLIREGVMALPGFAPDGGPFAHRSGSILHAHRIGTACERATLATVYVALVTDFLLDQLRAHGEIILDGPLASNALYAQLLQALRPRDPVLVVAHRHAHAGAARYLVTGLAPVAAASPAAPALQCDGLDGYRRAWLRQIAG